MYERLLAFVFPPQCAICAEIGSGLCTRCVPLGDRVSRRLTSLRVEALGAYVGALREAVLAVKDGRRDVATALGERLCDMLPRDAVVVPVPTTRRRVRARGLDGVALMAQIASQGRSLAVLRLDAADAQRGRSRQDRLAARGRFTCCSERVRGRRVVLVDDVCTTGATLEDCAAALRAAGASVLTAFVVATAN